MFLDGRNEISLSKYSSNIQNMKDFIEVINKTKVFKISSINSIVSVDLSEPQRNYTSLLK